MSRIQKMMALALVINVSSSYAQEEGFQEIAPIQAYTYGVRPFYLLDDLQAGELKDRLMSCAGQVPRQSDFVIGHRGAPLQFPEHTKESYIAAARQGAGMLECDVTFTKDKALVCRHAQNDLHTTTNILATPLAEKCSTPFTPAKYNELGELLEEAQAECRTSDITLAEFKTLKGKMDAANPKARTLEEYMQATPAWRTDLYAQEGTLLTHQEAIELFKALGVKMTPELKQPVVAMPFEEFSQQDFAKKLVDEYQQAGVAPEAVFMQSFSYDDILFWLKNAGEYGKQAVFLDEDLQTQARIAQMASLKKDGLNYLAPAIPMLLQNDKGNIVPSQYAREAKAQGLNLIAWSIERSGPLAGGGGWYYSGLNDLIHKDGDLFNVLDVLAKDVGITALFSDWPATVTYYANCVGL